MVTGKSAITLGSIRLMMLKYILENVWNSVDLITHCVKISYRFPTRRKHMSTKKVYCKGFKYSLYQSLIKPTMIVLENNGKFGIDRLEAQITCSNGLFNVLITDGYTYLKLKSGYKSLKQAMNHSHSWMIEFRKELLERKVS